MAQSEENSRHGCRTDRLPSAERGQQHPLCAVLFFYAATNDREFYPFLQMKYFTIIHASFSSAVFVLIFFRKCFVRVAGEDRHSGEED